MSKFTAKKITEGKKTYVVLFDEAGNEISRVGGSRAVRANWAIIGKDFRTVRTVPAGQDIQLADGERLMHSGFRAIDVGTVQVDARSSYLDPCPWNEAFDKAEEVYGHLLQNPEYRRRANLRVEQISQDGDTITYSVELLAPKAWKVLASGPVITGVRQDMPTIKDGRVGFASADEIIPVTC